MNVTDSAQPINGPETAIFALMNSEDNGIRYYAAWWLGKNRIHKSIPFLCECLKDERDRTVLEGYPLRRQAARSLGMLKNSQAVPALIEALDCSDIKVQEVVIQALRDIASYEAVPALLKLLNSDRNYKPDEALIEALTAFEVWEVQEKIKPFLKHSSERVKCAAAQYFYALTLEPHYLQILFKTLDHDNRFVRYAAAFDLSRLGQVEIAPFIVKAEIPNNIKLASLKHILELFLQGKRDKEVRREENTNFLFQIIDDLLLDAIEGNIPSSLESNWELKHIMEFMNEQNKSFEKVPQNLIAELIGALKSRDPNVKCVAIQGLVQLAPAIVDSIIQIFETEDDGDLKAGLTQVLMQIGDPRTVCLLEKLIGLEVVDHCQGKIRRVASRALGKIGCQSCEPEVITRVIKKLEWTLLNPDDWALRYSAAVSLEEIGNNDAISVLQVAYECEHDNVVQTRIKRALVTIT